MRNLMSWWLDEIREQPVIAAWMVLFLVHAGMNASLGYAIGGGEGYAALLYGASFLGFAVVGAWAADQYLHGTGKWRAGLAALALCQVLIGQMAGWQSFGLTLNTGAAKLESKAETRATTHSGLKAARAELAQIGIVRPVATIEAEERLECTIRSSQYKDGVGPKCTKLRAELATAQRVRQLEEQVGKLTGALADGPAIKDANALYAAPQALFQGVANVAAMVMGGKPAQISPDDVRFGWMVFLVASLEFFGTFGLALLRQRHGEALPLQPAGGPGGNGHGAGPGGRGPIGGPGRGPGNDNSFDLARLLAAPAPVLSLAAPSDAGLSRGPSAAHQQPGLGADGAEYGFASGQGGAAYGAPIHIHFAAGASPASGSQAPAMPAPAASNSPAQALPFHAPDAQSASEGARKERHNLAALPADAPPVDRSHVMRPLAPEEREAADVILPFRAACIVDAPGGLVDAEHLYRRYATWAGERALAVSSFHALFRDLTGIEAAEIGGLPHYRGIALRAMRKLQAVA